MKKLLKVLSLSLILSMVLALAAPGAFGEDVTITFFYNNHAGSLETEMLEKILSGFQEAHPDINLVAEPVNAANDGLNTRITTAYVANDLPDVFQYWGGFALAEMAGGGLIMDAQDYLDVSTKIKKDDIAQAAWDAYSYQGIMRGYPTHTAFPAWFANKAIFDQCGLEIPTTMQELMDIAPVLRENGFIPLAMGSSGANPAHFFLSELMHQYAGGTEEIRTLGQTNQFDTENLRKTAQMILDLKAAGVFPEDTIANGDWGPTFELYNGGRAAMIYTYGWMYANMSEETYANSVIINAPVVDGGTVDPSGFTSFFVNFGFLVTQKAWDEKQEAMTAFIDWLLSDEAAQYFADGGAMTPKNITVIIANPVFSDVVAHVQGRERVGSHYAATGSADAWNGFSPACDELFAGALTAEEFAQKVQSYYK